ncbi:putative secreted protein [Streptomyces davaonensis JCM 4913]|uniref:Putative secreted protein n=1 Tax=Streptomyces davaonensis (strain DSM 101723 / JCM 4913 / KCC S-0913 / 768) TaxID=1214101 RepID=K4RB05_STRDJ|nr:hypothetical protein [Streptomyces davaonensis]CCK29969.1 putative secreted protein [Streptomyces davaonensis JCM 4913]
MRALPARRIAVSALSATLLLGIAGPAAVAADDSARERTHAASHAPVPGADALLAQVKSLGDVGGVLSPVAELLNAVLKADNGQLPAADAQKLGQAVKDAIAKATAAAPVAPPAVAVPGTSTSTSTAPTTPATSATPALPATPTLPTTLPTLPTLTKSDDSKAPSAELPADLVADALAGLQKAVDALLTAVTSGNVAAVLPAATAVVTGLVNLVAATLLGGGLPAPSLAGLPALPSLPVATPQLPVGGGLLPAS